MAAEKVCAASELVLNQARVTNWARALHIHDAKYATVRLFAV